jgi:hypothetical protein
MHVSINVKSPNNISEWQMGFNSAFQVLKFRQFFSSQFGGQILHAESFSEPKISGN